MKNFVVVRAFIRNRAITTHLIPLTMTAILCVISSFGQTTNAPDIIKVPLSRVENIRQSIGMVITLDKGAVSRALANTPLQLPDPFPAGAKVGYDYEDDFFVLYQETEGGKHAYLTVDTNMNHDLRDDTRVEIPISDPKDKGVIIKIKRSYPDLPSSEAYLPYRFSLSQGMDKAGGIVNDIFFSPAYRMQGEFAFQGKTYILQLNDYAFLGRFDRSNLSQGTVLRVYLKEGECPATFSSLWGYELIPLGTEYYEVRDGALDGSWIELARNTLPHAAIGRNIPNFELVDTNGKKLQLSDYRGQYLLLDFWFSGCVPCLREYPNIKKVVASYKGKPLSVVGINLDTEKRLDRARKVVTDNALPWRQVMEGKGSFLPIYQILGLLPERRMMFPLNVVIDPKGVIRYATNDFRKMERYLDYAMNDEKERQETLFVPLALENTHQPSPPVAVDFKSETLDRLFKNPKVKLPADLSGSALVGRLPNDTLLMVRPSARADRLILRLDANRDLDLTNDEDKEIQVLSEVPQSSVAAVPITLTIRFSNGGLRGLRLSFFALHPSSGSPEALPSVQYFGFTEEHSGSFFLDDHEYAIRIVDPTYDGLFTPADAEDMRFLTLRMKQDNGWTDIYNGTSHIPIGGHFFKLKHVHEDGCLVELEAENR